MKKVDLKKFNPNKLLIGTIIVVALLWLWTPFSYLIGEIIPILTIENRGEYGDMFGGVNAFFAGMALIGVVFTTYVQQLELQDQNETLKIQQFEHSFFSMLKVHNDIVVSMCIRKKEKPYDIIHSGRDSFTYLHRELRKKFKGPFTVEEGQRHFSGSDITRELYGEWWVEYRTKLSHYYRFLYHMVTFVEKEFKEEYLDNKKNTDNRKKKDKYIKIIRAQLSDQEQAILFYNCIAESGEGFRPLTIKYNLIKHVPDELLFGKNHKQKYYPELFK